MTRLLYIPKEGPAQQDVKREEWAAALADSEAVVWLDITGGGQEADAILSGLFAFHPLAIADALQQQHVPRVDEWDDYVYCVIGELSLDVGGEISVRHDELDMFLGPNYLVTLHDGPSSAVDHVWESASRHGRRPQHGPDHLMYELMTSVTSGYMTIMDDLDAEIDRCQDSIFEDPSKAVLNRFFDLKRALLAMRRILTPTRELLNRLARDEYSQIDQADRIYFRDVYDHLVRLVDINESLRDLVTGAMDMYLSVVSNRLNEIMKVLTIWTVLFMPLTFITGFFGMNFFGASYEVPTGFPRVALFVVSLALMLGSAAGFFWWMKRRGWLDGGIPEKPKG